MNETKGTLSVTVRSMQRFAGKCHSSRVSGMRGGVNYRHTRVKLWFVIIRLRLEKPEGSITKAADWRIKL